MTVASTQIDAKMAGSVSTPSLRQRRSLIVCKYSVSCSFVSCVSGSLIKSLFNNSSMSRPSFLFAGVQNNDSGSRANSLVPLISFYDSKVLPSSRSDIGALGEYRPVSYILAVLNGCRRGAQLVLQHIALGSSCAGKGRLGSSFNRSSRRGYCDRSELGRVLYGSNRHGIQILGEDRQAHNSIRLRLRSLIYTLRDGRLQLNVVLSIGQNEVDTTSERIRFVNEASIRQGKAIFGEGNMPRGYKLGTVDGKKCMVKDPDQEELVNAFFDYFEKHQSKQGTLRYMQKNYDPEFSYSVLRTMLSSEFYKGTYRGIPYCPAYLPEERWERIQQISKGKNVKIAPSGRIYYFSGMIRCPVCGQILSGTGCKSIINRKTGEKRDYCYYRCNHAMIDRICTNRHRLSQNLVESYLLENLEREFAAYKIRVEDIRRKKKKEARAPRTERQIEKEMERLNILFQKGRVTWDYYSGQYDALEKEKADLKLVIAEPETDYSSIEELLGQDFRAIYNSLTPENRRSFWRNTIRQIHIGPDYTVKKVDFI